MREQTAQAYAKINLSLKVLNKRPDSYHTIESVMQMVNFGDTVTVRHEEAPGIRLTTNRKDLPLGDENIAYRAARVMQEHFQIPGGFSIHLEKRIPVAAGLAGGSTNAATVMRLIQQICKLSVSEKALFRLGLSLGADVPFCLKGGAALAEGIGEELTTISGCRNCYIVLANPGVSISTAMIYKALDEGTLPTGGDTHRLLQCLEAGDLPSAFLDMKNVMEDVTKQFCPAVTELLDKLTLAGAAHSMMSGSGATCFGIFTEKPEETKLVRLLGDQLIAITTPR